MKRWRRRSLKLRLAFWHAAISSLLLVTLAVFVFEVVEHRLRAELDRQLRIDFDLVAAELDQHGPEEKLRWPVRGAHGDDGYGRLAAWFEVWSESGKLVLRQWPVPDEAIDIELEPPRGRTLRFHTMSLEEELWVRLMERPARIDGEPFMVRMFRDESNMRHTLTEIATVFWIGVPLAVLLSAGGGYFLAGRSLSPLAAMAEQARQITAESLDERLPVRNPHDELGRLAVIFNQTIKRLERSFAELKRFTADASHELRTPLTALRAVGEIGMREPDDPAALRESISSMLEEAQTLNGLIDALLLLSRADSGSIQSKLEPVNVAASLEEIASSLEILAQEKRQTLSCELDGKPAALADRMLFRQAVLNLLDNAIRHSPAEAAVTVRASSQNGCVHIEVEDDGPGIAPEEQERIFERFARIDKSRARAQGGSGLGLAIAKWAVEQQGGRIELESRPGRGSVFRIFLPAT